MIKGYLGPPVWCLCVYWAVIDNLPCLSTWPILVGLAIGALAHCCLIRFAQVEKDEFEDGQDGKFWHKNIRGCVTTSELGHENDRPPRFLGECSDLQKETTYSTSIADS